MIRTLDTPEVRSRAAEIRQHWSPLEKLRRTGLPPDIPPKLRKFILGPSQPGWSTAARAVAYQSKS